MAQKAKIQYVGQFYVYGSEAHKLVQKPKKAKLLRLNIQQGQKVYIDPLALCGLVAAFFMLVMMVFGAFRLRTSLTEYNQVSESLTELKQKNAQLLHTYHTSYDVEEVRELAKAYGMVDAEDADQYTVFVRLPQEQKAPNAWDNFVWFFTGLFAGAKE